MNQGIFFSRASAFISYKWWFGPVVKNAFLFRFQRMRVQFLEPTKGSSQWLVPPTIRD